MENQITMSNLLQKMVKKITELDIMEPKPHQFKDIIDFIDSFTKINIEYRLLFLLFKEYFLENNVISQNICEQEFKLIISLIDIDNNEEEEEELVNELYDEDELFKDFYVNFVQEGEYSTIQTIFAYYYYQIFNDLQSFLESYILIKCQRDDYLIPIIPKNIPNITDDSALFFQLFKQFEDRLLNDKNTGTYKIIIEKNMELLLSKANLEIDEFEEHINSANDDKLKKIFKKKFPELFTFKNKMKLIKKKKEEEDRNAECKTEESYDKKDKKENEKKNEKIKIPDKREEKDNLSYRDFEKNEFIEINNNEENNQSNKILKGKDEMEKHLEKMEREHNEQKKRLNLELEIAKLNDKIAKQNDKIENQNDIIEKQNDKIAYLNNELKSKTKKLTKNEDKNRRQIKLLTSIIIIYSNLIIQKY